MEHLWQFEAIGTNWRIRTAADAAEIRSEVLELIGEFDRLWSRFRTDSAVAGLAAGEAVDLGADAAEIFALYDWLDDSTSGAVNPLVGQSLEHLGYDREYGLQPGKGFVPAPPWSTLRRVGSTVSADQPVVLDIGAVGKGFLVDLVANLLVERLGAAVVNAGGDIANRSGEPISVALEHPNNPDLAIGVVAVANGQALCGSATNRRTWADGLHHVLDARTGRPAESVAATWALGPSAAKCDALSTAAFFVEPGRLVDAEHEVLRISRAGEVDASCWTGELFT